MPASRGLPADQCTYRRSGLTRPRPAASLKHRDISVEISAILHDQCKYMGLRIYASMAFMQHVYQSQKDGGKMKDTA